MGGDHHVLLEDRGDGGEGARGGGGGDDVAEGPVGAAVLIGKGIERRSVLPGPSQQALHPVAIRVRRLRLCNHQY